MKLSVSIKNTKENFTFGLGTCKDKIKENRSLLLRAILYSHTCRLRCALLNAFINAEAYSYNYDVLLLHRMMYASLHAFPTALTFDMFVVSCVGLFLSHSYMNVQA